MTGHECAGMSETLTDFLLARIAEDEARVDEVPDWYCTGSARGEGWGSRGDCPLCGHYMFDGTEDVTEQALWDHLEDTHRRSRVLAECAAKRQIVAMFPHAADGDGWNNAGEEVLMHLAAIYADHPDYRAEWVL